MRTAKRGAVGVSVWCSSAYGISAKCARSRRKGCASLPLTSMAFSLGKRRSARAWAQAISMDSLSVVIMRSTRRLKGVGVGASVAM